MYLPFHLRLVHYHPRGRLRLLAPPMREGAYNWILDCTPKLVGADLVKLHSPLGQHLDVGSHLLALGVRWGISQMVSSL